jgi:hypothetical protein
MGSSARAAPKAAKLALKLAAPASRFRRVNVMVIEVSMLVPEVYILGIELR